MPAQLKIGVWVSVGITIVLFLFGVIADGIVADIIIFLFPVPGVLILSISYITWGIKPQKGWLVGTAIASIIAVVIYTLVIGIVVFILYAFGEMVNDMWTPEELIGTKAIDTFPMKIKPYIQDADSSYYARIGFEEPYHFIGYNIAPAFRDSVILGWFELSDIPERSDVSSFGVSDYFHHNLPLLHHYWNPSELKHAVYLHYTEDPRSYSKTVIYDSLGTRVLLYSWFE